MTYNEFTAYLCCVIQRSRVSFSFAGLLITFCLAAMRSITVPFVLIVQLVLHVELVLDENISVHN